MTRLLRRATLLAAFSLLTSAATAHAESVAEMATSCKSVGEAKVSGHGVEFVEDYRAGICWGAFCAVQRVIVQAFVPDPTPSSAFVPRKREHAFPTRRGVCRVCEADSTASSRGFFDVAIVALRDAFPCQPR
jgi:hypothetical protein